MKLPPEELTVETYHIMQDMTNLEALKPKLKPLDIDVVVHLAAQGVSNAHYLNKGED